MSSRVGNVQGMVLGSMSRVLPTRGYMLNTSYYVMSFINRNIACVCCACTDYQGTFLRSTQKGTRYLSTSWETVFYPSILRIGVQRLPRGRVEYSRTVICPRVVACLFLPRCQGVGFTRVRFGMVCLGKSYLPVYDLVRCCCA